MRTLREGMSGDDVRAWEHFLLGRDPMRSLVVDGTFDTVTKKETKDFQLSVGFTGRDVDGVVGPGTMGRAMTLGFDPLIDDSDDKSGPNWPAMPIGAVPMSPAVRAATFGQFAFKPAGDGTNPEAIIITDGWDAKNIVTITIPQLSKLTKNGKVSVHKLIVNQLTCLFETWEREGLMDRVLTWGGSWAPRFIRGSRTSLSNHAWGTAFDINAQWNGLGARPALLGDHGCVRELVLSAYDHGFFNGMWFKTRMDGMHFECCKVLP
jgi:hypothetical protein